MLSSFYRKYFSVSKYWSLQSLFTAQHFVLFFNFDTRFSGFEKVYSTTFKEWEIQYYLQNKHFIPTRVLPGTIVNL